MTFEYILIAGVNDTDEQACELAKIARRLSAKINLISYNTVEGLEWSRPSRARQEKFQSNDTDEQACELAKIARRDAGDQDVVEHHASFFPRLSNRKLRVTP